MRIGILTYHRSINNGAVMQCYSLAKRVQQEFPNAQVEVIDYHLPKIAAGYEPSLKQHLKGLRPPQKVKRLLSLAKYPGKLKAEKKRKQAFESVLANLPLSPDCIFEDGTEKVFAYIQERYDIVIAGSDAIWNYTGRGFPNAYFLDDKLSCRKLSYAASCYGMSYEQIPQEHKQAFRRILSSYDFLGVRDGESEKFLEHIGVGSRGVHTCDPTVFLDVNDLPISEEELKEKLRKKGFDFEKPAIGIMGTERLCKMVRRFYADKYQLVGLYNYYKETDVNLYDLTPYEWAYVFRYFKLTFTTYFHGTMLSLRNGTPVICLALETEYSKNHMTKVEDVLRRVGLQDCYFHTDYLQQNVQKIREKADELLQTQSRQEIIEKMDIEAQSAQPFIEALRILIDKEKTEND